jgi:DNA-binding MarR family transcriptional regulator
VLTDAVQAVLGALPTIHAALRRRQPPRPARARGRASPPASARRLSAHLTGLLDLLASDRAVSVGELAARLGVTPATISVQLTRLEQGRLIVRERDARDGRRVGVRLTESGARLRGQRSLLDPARVRAALARLPGPERDAAAAGVVLLARAARELAGAGGAGRSAA